jgi:hypothetical protein
MQVYLYFNPKGQQQLYFGTKVGVPTHWVIAWSILLENLKW